ncbi:MAG TPA: class I SAM-dependent methyltransferase [Terracidiphilus sp.]|jgi:ubiquinone/menaquinone biosynthesis C-methylase UbiE
MNTTEFDRVADEYENLHAANIAITGERPEYFHEYKIRALQRMTQQRCIDVKCLLDFGSGIGNSIPFLRKYFPQAQATGADVSRRSLAIAETRFPGMATGLLIEEARIPAEDNSFDVAFSACVFHHIPWEEHVDWLAELRRVTRPAGMLAVFEHNPRNPLTVRAVNTCPFDENARLIGAERLADLLRAAGWGNVETKYHVFFPHALAALRILDTYLIRVPFGGQYSVSAVKQ